VERGAVENVWLISIWGEGQARSLYATKAGLRSSTEVGLQVTW
jgi:hypothetical protein